MVTLPYLRLWREYKSMSMFNASNIIYSPVASIGIVTTVMAPPEVMVRRGGFGWVVVKAVSKLV